MKLDPVLPLAHHNYGYLLWSQDNHQQALEHFQIALARSPLSAISNFAVADSLFVTGQINKALAQYQHCNALLPDYPACHLGIANFYRFALNQQLAQKHMQLASRFLSDDNIYWVMAKAIDAFWLGNYTEAKEFQSKVVKIRGGGYLELQLEILISFQQGNTQDGLITLEALAEQSPDNQSLKVALALNYYYLGRCKVATKLYESVLADNFDFHGKFNIAAWGVSHMTNLADCYLRANNLVAYKKMMLLLSQQAEKFQTGKHVLPGVLLVNAKIDFLAGRNAAANQKIDQLSKLNWTMEWLKEVDPFLRMQLTNTIATKTRQSSTVQNF